MSKKPTKRIWIEGGIINYLWGEDHQWALPLTELEIVGEYTDPNGPYVDDYFFVFIARPEHYWYEASFYCDGSDQFLKELGQQLGAQISCGLVNSTDYNSRVMWPPEIEGMQLLELMAVESRGAWEKMKHKLVPEYNYALTETVKDFLNRGAGDGV
jgi:hypothetical protein